MPAHFYDTSAFVKHYVPEPGSATVDALLAGPGPHFVARLGLVEAHSAFAKKVRIGLASPTQFRGYVRLLRADSATGTLQVVRMRRRDDPVATRLIRRYGLSRNLRTLDALQLAVALRLLQAAPGLTFVSADQALLGIAAARGLFTLHV
jgi:uncharacterized protein